MSITGTQRCAHCGVLLFCGQDTLGQRSVINITRHEQKCRRATDAERAHYRAHRHWRWKEARP